MSLYIDRDAESRSFKLDLSMVMYAVYLWVALGLAIAFGVAYFVGTRAATWFYSNPVLSIGTLIIYVIVALALQPVIMRTRPGVGAAMYLGFTALFGLMMSSIFIVFEMRDIAFAFVPTTAMFAIMSVVGYTTKTDLTRFRGILMMALVGLIVATIVNIFLASSALYWIVNYAGVLIFAGLTAYDTQWIKNAANQVVASGSGEAAQRLALIGAFHLFLDFVNLFLFILRIVGSSRD